MGRMMQGVVWLCVFVLLLVFLAAPVTLIIAQRQLQTVFLHSKVTIARCVITLSSLSFSGVHIQKGRELDIVIHEARVSYDKELLLKFALKEVSLDGVSISVALGSKSIFKLKDDIRVPGGKSPFAIKAVRFAGVHADIRSKELECKGDFSLTVALLSQTLQELRVSLHHLDGSGVYLENANFLLTQLAQPADSRNVSIDFIKYGKVKLTQITGNVQLRERLLLLKSLKAGLFGGSLQADASLALEKKNAYNVRISVADIDLARLVRELEIEEKVQLSGTLKGEISAMGEGVVVQDLRGTLATGAQGGVVRIKDANLLGSPPSAPASPKTLKGYLDAHNILVESLKDYHYNTGLVKLHMQEGNLICDVALDGESGKRDLTTVVHDFSLRRWVR